MEASSVPAPQMSAATKAKAKPDPGPKTPWYLWLAVVGIVVFCLFPFYWLINISLKTGTDLTSSSLIPPQPTLKNYQEIFKNPDFTKALRNSAAVSLITTALSITVGPFSA